MSQLDKIVIVDIIKGQAGVSRVGFGIPFLISYQANFPETYKQYVNLAQVEIDFPIGTIEYERAQAIFDSTTRDNNGARMLTPDKMYIGRLPSNARVDALKETDGNYIITINGTAFTFVASGSTKALIAEGLATLINAGSEPVTAVYVATTEYLELHADVADTDFTLAINDKTLLQTGIARQISTLTLVGDLIADNVVNLNIVHNEVETAMTPITFLSDHETTMGLIATALETSPYIESAVVSLTPFRDIVITCIDDRIISLEDILVTLGISQTTGTWAEDTSFKNGTAKAYLNALAFQDYYMVIYNRDFFDNAEIVDLSDFIENWEYKKAFFFNTADIRVTTNITDNIAFDIKQKAIDRGKLVTTILRTFGCYTPQLTNYLVDGLIGANGDKNAGSITWAYQKIKLGIADDYVNQDAILGFLESNTMNWYTEIAGFSTNTPAKKGGRVIGGEYFDITRGSDWLQSNMELDMFEIFAKVDKVPYTNKGADVLETAVYDRLNDGVANGFLSDDEAPLVTSTDVNDLTPAVRKSRGFGKIQATARYAGAIQFVEIQINLSF